MASLASFSHFIGNNGQLNRLCNLAFFRVAYSHAELIDLKIRQILLFSKTQETPKQNLNEKLLEESYPSQNQVQRLNIHTLLL